MYVIGTLGKEENFRILTLKSLLAQDKKILITVKKRWKRGKKRGQI